MDKIDKIKIYVIICLIILCVFMIINKPEKKKLKLNEELDKDTKVFLCNRIYNDYNRIIKGCENYMFKFGVN